MPVLAAALLPVAGLGAQQRFEPHAELSVDAGVASTGTLWAVPAQPVLVVGSRPALFDTMALGRRGTAGPVVSVVLAWRRSRTMAWELEGGYFGAATRQECRGPAAWSPDPDQVNAQACLSADRARVATAVVALLAGASFRRGVGPVTVAVRGGAGLGQLIEPWVETSGQATTSGCPNICSVVLYSVAAREASVILASGALDVSVRAGVARQVRLEIRDLIVSATVVRGPSPATSTEVSTVRRFVHIPVVTAGIVWSLERRHEHRY